MNKLTLYMPRWQLQELRELRRLMFTSVTVEHICAQVGLFEGVPRMVLENARSWESYLREQQDTIFTASTSSLVIHKSEAGPSGSSTVVHIDVGRLTLPLPSAEGEDEASESLAGYDFLSHTMVFASKSTSDKVFQKLEQDDTEALGRLLRGGASGTLPVAGLLFEPYVDSMLQASNTFKLTWLLGQATIPAWSENGFQLGDSELKVARLPVAEISIVKAIQFLEYCLSIQCLVSCACR